MQSHGYRGEPYVKKFSLDAQQIFTQADRAKLKNPKALNEAGRFLEQNQFGLAVAATQAGMTGDTDQLRQLTEAQAMVVREYLVQNFRIDNTRIKTIGLGKARDAADGYKVEILVYPGSASVPRSKPRDSATGQ
jgi:hypothetical protein